MSGFVGEMAGMYTDTTDVDESLHQGILKKAFVGGQDFFECLVCHRSMAGVVPAQAHLKGSPHFKALRNHRYTSPLNDVFTRLHVAENVLTEQRHESPGAAAYSGNTSDEEMVRKAMDQGIVTRNNAAGVTSLTCELCKVSCTGEAPMAQHLDGEPHRKRQRRMGTSQQSGALASRLSVSPVRPVSDYSSQTSYTSGQSGFEEEDSLKKAFDDGIVQQDSSGGVDNLTCKVCCKSCTGSVPMRQHLKSSAHIKKLRIHVVASGGRQLPARSSPPNTYAEGRYSPLNTYPEGRNAGVTDARDYEEEGVSSSSSGPAISTTEKYPTPETDFGEMVIEVDGLLMCLVCQLQCTGEANMTEHLQGDHHRRKWRDQMDQLKMFGITAGTKIQPPPVSKPLSSQRVPSEYLQSSMPQAVSPSNPSNQSYRNISDKTSVAVLRPGVVPKRKSIFLPPNLSDLEVYFPGEMLGKNF
ncbi:uncharacterized protein [Palaemon carinicauda]|uniref:uncharacterized protein isoform X2 n=1 Tax=Palaemon carinicauda TaxID=392227 RepID=UPI0035B5A51F